MTLDSKVVGSADSLLTPPQRQTLKAALSAARSAGSVTLSQRESVRDISEQAGLLRRTPEQSLVAFKSVLNDVANESGIPLGRERANLIERFVSVFIEGFYASGVRIGDDGADRVGDTASRIIPGESREAPGALH